MSHRRIKDVSYEEDDYDDYEEEEAPAESSMTAEDQARLRQGAGEVREALGAESPATTKEIEEALWYYYYDVEKTVAYLLSTSK
jgi:elongation factor 1 alpha-like protein